MESRTFIFTFNTPKAPKKLTLIAIGLWIGISAYCIAYTFISEIAIYAASHQ